MAILSMTDMIAPVVVHNGPGDVEYKRTLLVLTTTALDDGVDVLEAGPPWGSVLETKWGRDSRARCTARRPETLGPLFWKLHLDYKTKFTAEEAEKLPDDSGQEPEKQAENPLERPPRLRGNSTTRQKARWKDLDGKPFRNGAGMPFSRPLVTEVFGLSFEIEQNEPFPRIPLLAKFANTVNETDFLGLDPKTVAYRGHAFGDPEFEFGKLFYRLTYRFEYDPEGWIHEELNTGLLQVESIGAKPPVLVPIKDKFGVPVSVPWPLTEGGQAINDLFNDKLSYLKFRVHNDKDFNSLFFKAPRFQL